MATSVPVQYRRSGVWGSAIRGMAITDEAMRHFARVSNGKRKARLLLARA